MKTETILVLGATIYIAPHLPKWLGVPFGLLLIVAAAVSGIMAK